MEDKKEVLNFTVIDCMPNLYLINGDRRTKDCHPYKQIDIIKFIYEYDK